MKSKSLLFGAFALLASACWLLNLGAAEDFARFRTSRGDGNPLPAPVKLEFKLSETSLLPDTTQGKLPQGSAVEYVESAMLVETNGMNHIELTLRDGRKVALEFRIRTAAKG